MACRAHVFLSTIALVGLFGCESDTGSDGSDASGGSTTPPTETATTFGEPHSGQYHLGPVDFAETEWHNACANVDGYASELCDSTGLGGEYLAGVSGSHAEGGAVCDRCILIETATGRSIVARVITYGDTNEPGDIDVSPSVYAALDTGEYPRSMTWQFARCPDVGPIRYEFQFEANVWWTSLWVRNARIPITRVEVMSTNHPEFVELERGTDGTLTDASGFGEGAFTLRLTGIDEQVLTDSFDGFEPGSIVDSSQQFE